MRGGRFCSPRFLLRSPGGESFRLGGCLYAGHQGGRMRMLGSRPQLTRRTLLFVLNSLLVGAATIGCDSGGQPSWPWWTARDSAAVRSAIASWHGVLAAWPMLADTLRLNLSVGLTYEDSVSTTGDTLYKLAHILRAWFEPTDSVHAEVLQFGVTADTVAMRDTFCEVAYRDSMAACRINVGYDSIWVVGYRPDTLIDTTRTPPETTVTFRASISELRGFAEPQVEMRLHSWSGFRKLFLKRTTDTTYVLRKLTGFRVATPTAEEAPSVTRVVLRRPGKQDTLFYAPRKDGRGLYNLRPVDSLYALRVGEVLGVEVAVSTPSDTISLKNRFYLTVSGRRADITANARQGIGSASFSGVGYEHLYLEVVPTTALVYPNRSYTSTVWAIPVVVQE